MRIGLLVTILALALGGRTRRLPAQEAAKPTVTGRWQYSEKDSDNPREVLPGRRDSTGGGVGRRGGGRRGGGGRGGFGGGLGGGFGGSGGYRGGGGDGLNDGSRAKMRETMELALDPPLALSLALDDSSLVLVHEDLGDTLRLNTDGKKYKQKLGNDMELESRATQQGGAVVLERKVNGGGKVTETYFLTSNHSQLVVLVKLEGGYLSKPIEFHRVYDPAGGSGS